MQLPELETASAWAGDWLAPDDLDALIEPVARRYAQRYARDFYGDWEDLAQEARLALWLLQKEKGFPDRIRELEGIGAITTAIRGEVERTKRAGPLMHASQEVDWRVLAVPDRQLTETQQEVLYRFQMVCSQAARSPYWTFVWLVEAAGWSPEMVTLYFRKKKDTRHYYSPQTVLKGVEKAKRRIRERIPQDYIEEVNNLSTIWW